MSVVQETVEHCAHRGSIEARFSDHTKKRMTYNKGSGPKEIKALSEKLSPLQEKLV
jgi:hypothetical protein